MVQSAGKPCLRLEAAAGVQLFAGLEGGIDTSHVTYVHRYEVDDDPLHMGTKANDYIKADGNVIFEIEKNPFGLTLYGRRNGEPDSYYWRVTQWLFPWFTLSPPFGDHALGGHVWVPIDDYNCWAWSINFHPNKPLSADERHNMEEGKGIHCPYEPGTFRRSPTRTMTISWTVPPKRICAPIAACLVSPRRTLRSKRAWDQFKITRTRSFCH